MKSAPFHSMLRTRLFASLLPLVIVLLAMGVYAIVLFSRLANSFDAAFTGHYQSIYAAEVMRQSLAGMEREAPSARDTRTGDSKLFNEYQKGFESNFIVQQSLATTLALKDLTYRLSTNYDAFLKLVAAPETVRSPRDQVTDRASGAYASVVARMGELLQKIREENYQAVLDTSNRIQQSARAVTRLMLVGIVLVLVISAYTFYQLGRTILRPILLVTRATRELGEGNPAPLVPVVSHDELGELAVAFNTMAAQLEDYRRNTSEEIIRLHRTMEAMLASFPDPIFVLGRAGEIELKNPAAEDLAAELDLNGQLPDRLQLVARRALDTGEDFLPHSFDEAVSYRVHNTEKSFLPRVLAMHDRQSHMFGVAVVLYDVTRFRLLDAAKTNLVATVSHELNTPLTSVRMALHLLLEKSIGSLTPKQDELLRTARNDTERLLRILYDLLDLARLDEGSDGLRKENVTPADLLRGVIDDTADKVASRGLKLACTVEPDLPRVSVDRQRIGHVFGNLMTNAIKYSPPGGEILLLATRTGENDVAFTVADQGPGIPEEYHARIFDRFFRAPGQTSTGAGLGLSIAREITVAHGGRIGVKSTPGHGSTFVVVLKAVEE